MSHFLKQRVKSFKDIQSMATALEKIGGKENTTLMEDQTLSIWGNQKKKVDLLCRKKGFKTILDFGFTEEDDHITLHCDTMDRNRIEKIQQNAQTEHITEEVVSEMNTLGFYDMTQTVGNQGQKELVFSRWK